LKYITPPRLFHSVHKHLTALYKLSTLEIEDKTTALIILHIQKYSIAINSGCFFICQQNQKLKGAHHMSKTKIEKITGIEEEIKQLKPLYQILPGNST